MSGVAMTRSKSILPPWIGFHQVLGADDFGAGLLGFLGLVALGEHRDADVLAGALGQVDDAADHLVGVARIDAQVRCATSTVSSNLAVARLFTRPIASSTPYSFSRSTLPVEGLLLLGQLRHGLSPPQPGGPSRERSLR